MSDGKITSYPVQILRNKDGEHYWKIERKPNVLGRATEFYKNKADMIDNLLTVGQSITDWAKQQKAIEDKIKAEGGQADPET